MSYENPITVVDTESAKIRAAGLASFGQSIGGAITSLGQRQRAEARERKKANLKEADDFIKYNDTYQANIFSATDKFKEEADFDISGEATNILNKWADEGARLKAARDRSDDPEERRKLQKQISVYDKFFLGGGMTNSFSAISELQQAIKEGGAPNKIGRVGGLSASSTNPDIYKDFLRLVKGGGSKGMKLEGINSVFDSETETYSSLSLLTNFNEGGSYTSDQINSAELVYVPDMQEGVQDVLKKQGLVNDKNIIDTNSKQFIDNFAKKENGSIVYSTRKDVNGNEIRYVDIDFDKFKSYLNATYKSTIDGYSEGAGDETSMGYREMQAYIGDILDDIPIDQQEEFKTLTGFGVDDLTLQTGNHENTILSKESYDNFQNALAAQKYLEIKNKVPGVYKEKPKQLSVSDQKALKELKNQKQIDNQLNLTIEKALLSGDRSDEGLYNYLMDPENANSVNYSAIENKKFRNKLRPIEEIEDYVNGLDEDTLIKLTDKDKEDYVQELKDNAGDSKFFSLIKGENFLKPLDEIDAYNIMLQDIPMFEDMSTRKLSSARSEVEMSDKYLDPKIDKKARQQLGSPEEYVSRKMAENPLQDLNKLKLKYLDELQKLKAKLKANK